MALVLSLATKPLWLPTTATSFPQIPMFQRLCHVPLAADWTLTVGLCLGLVVCCIPGRMFKVQSRQILPLIGSGMVLVCGIALVALNQHRFQPWFYQLLIFAVFFMWGGSANSMQSPAITQLQIRWLRAIVISIYFYSAIGKFDFEFLHTVGQQFLRVAFDAANLDVQQWGWSARLWLASLFPITELLLAMLLAMGQYKGGQWIRVAAVLACLFHVSLMVILGLGLGHSASVVLWNLQFAVQALLLFGLGDGSARHVHRVEAESKSHVAALRTQSKMMLGFTFVVVALPVLERWGYWDHWPSWALYAPHSSRVALFVAAPAVARLPADLQKVMAEEKNSALDELWVRVPLAKWSLTSHETPIYPQARFELGVARYLAQHVRSRFAIKVIVLGAAARFDGHRTTREFVGSDEIERAGESFLWNTRPRFSIAR